MSNFDKEKIDYVRLVNTSGIGQVLFYRLLQKYKSADKVLEFLEVERKIKPFPKSLAEAEFEKAEKLGVSMVFFCDEKYPYLLKQIYDVPPVLYVRGNIDALNHKSVGLVGSRNASLNSRNFTSGLARVLVDNDFCVISGMAIGIDTEVHKGALSSSFNNGAKTVAVLAGGVDKIYPSSNRNLYDMICEQGAVVSEMRIGTQPQANLFPRRNRIISGLSLGIAVMEASLKSGSLITARFAMEQGREVFAVPNFPMDPRAGGTNELIKNGATILTSADDIITSLNNAKPADIKKVANRDLFVNEECEDISFEDLEIENVDLEVRILSLLNSTPVSVDHLIRELSSEYSYSQISNSLLNLELNDKIFYPSLGKVILKL
ncbi:MAG: DNA-processing protein DprA [Alphaproteobacteria bacterium]